MSRNSPTLTSSTVPRALTLIKHVDEMSPLPVRAALVASLAAAALACPPVLNVLDYGAKGDGAFDSSAAIASTIAAAGACEGGARVLLPAPGVYLSGPLWLQSNVDLHVQTGATLSAITDFSRWPNAWKGEGFGLSMVGFVNAAACASNSSACSRHAAWARLKNVSISGGGTIDGNGDVWWQARNWWPTLPAPWLLDLWHVDGLSVSDVTLFRSAYWTVNPALSRNVTINGVTIEAGNDRASLPYQGWNVDGVDSNNVQNMSVLNSVIRAGDDCLALNSRNQGPDDWPSSGILVRNVSCITPISLGSGTGNGVYNVVIDNCTVTAGWGNASAAWRPKWWRTGVRFKTARGRGPGGIHNVTISAFKAVGLDLFLDFQSYYSCQNSSGTANYDLCRTSTQLPPQPVEDTPTFTNITVRGVRGDAWRAAWLNCLPEKPCTGVSFDDVQLDTQEGWACENVNGTAGPNVTPPPVGCFTGGGGGGGRVHAVDGPQRG